MSIDKILHSINLDQKFLIGLLIRWANINSHTFNPRGLTLLRRELVNAFDDLGGKTRAVRTKPYETLSDQGEMVSTPLGEMLTIVKRPRAPLQILCVSHMDTVYPAESLFQTTAPVSSGILKGPGVADAKGGIAVMLLALRALEKSDLRRYFGWRVVINADEEIGSPGSSPFLKRYAEKADLGIVFEPALPDGSLVSARKGSGNFSLVIHGVAAHAGRAFYQGKNAIEAAAGAVTKLAQLSGKRNGLTVNTGRISGGGALNIVPDLAIVRFNMRIKTAADERFARKQMADLLKHLNRKKGIRAVIRGSFGAYPKIPSRKEKGIYRDLGLCARALGQKIRFKPSGGVCDSNRLAAKALPIIDGAGVCGGDIHSPREFMYIDSLAARSKLVTLYLARLLKGEFTL